jgi:PiT family inorganic phosphate transporter
MWQEIFEFFLEYRDFIYVIVLSVLLGIEVISNVPAVLHTPLMSGANAIHGVVIVGAIIVLGAYAFGTDQVHWSSVMGKVVLPMVVSPLVAIPMALALFLILEPLSRRFSLTTSHWISSGAASFSRGVNDAPKVAALGAFFFLTGDGNWAEVPTALLFVIAALGMTLGSLFASRKVSETLAERVAPIGNVEGLAANATTTFLLLFASGQGLPISLTYVISSSIVGLGFRREIKNVCWRTVEKMVISWVVTVPISGFIAIGAFFLLQISDL